MSHPNESNLSTVNGNCSTNRPSSAVDDANDCSSAGGPSGMESDHAVVDGNWPAPVPTLAESKPTSTDLASQTGPIEVPRIASLFELECLCDPRKPDAEFWQLFVIQTAREFGVRTPEALQPGSWDTAVRSLKMYRLNLRRVFSFQNDPPRYDETQDIDEAAEQAVTDEINLSLKRFLGAEPMPATKTKPKTARETAFEKLKLNGKSRAKPAAADAASVEPQTNGKPRAPLPVDPLATVEVIEEGEFAYSFFKRTKLNPRTSFDADLIASMAPTIESICRMTPILCLADGTIVDGETRHRAAEKAGAKKLFGKKIKCTEEQAAIIRLQTTVKRADLNPIDRANAMKDLQDKHHLTVDEIAKIVGMEKGDSVRNIVRLLELPDEWRTAVQTGELTAAAARELVPWIDEPDVLKDVRHRLANCDASARSSRLSGFLQDAIFSCSRKMSGYANCGNHYGDVNLKPDEAQRAALRIRKIKRHGASEDRAFNVKLWEQMVNEQWKAKAKAEAAREAKKNSKDGKSSNPKRSAENAKKQKEIFNKRLFKFRTQWYQAQALAWLKECDHATLLTVVLFLTTRSSAYNRSEILSELCKQGHNDEVLQGMLGAKEDKLFEFARELCSRELSGRFEGFNSVFDPEDIEAIAKHLKVDIAKHWSKSFDAGAPCELLWDAFTALWTRDQMLELLNEWNNVIDPAGLKRSEVAAYLPKNAKCPKAILEAKAVRLV